VRSLGALALCACTGTTGTLQLQLVTAPDSQLLDAVERLRLTITNPRQVVESARTAGGFDLALEVDASDATGALVVEGFDADGSHRSRWPRRAARSRARRSATARRSRAAATPAAPRRPRSRSTTRTITR